MTQWLQCLLTKLEDPRAHVNGCWSWRPICNFSLRRQKWDLQSKPASKTSHSNEFWVSLRDLASMNKVEKDQLRMTLVSTLGLHMHAHTYERVHMCPYTCKNRHVYTYMPHTHEDGKVMVMMVMVMLLLLLLLICDSQA